MKKALLFALSIVIALSLGSCTNKEDTTDIVETTQNSDIPDHISDDQFADDDLLKFECGKGTINLMIDSMFVFSENGTGNELSLVDMEQKEYTDVQMPFGAKIGDNVEDFIEKYSLDSGYAAYVDMGSEISVYEEGKLPDFKDGGYLYFAYMPSKTGNWIFFDYENLLYLMRGKIQLLGFEDGFNVIVCTCTVDSNGKITSLTEIYGDIETVMAVTSGQ